MTAPSSRRPPAPPVTLDHIGVAVRDAGPVAAVFARLFGLETGEPEAVGNHRVRFIGTGDTTIELVEALEPDAPVAKFLAARGDALHHICLRVPDIDAAVEALLAGGVRMIDRTPRPGAHGSRIAFIHPASAGGLLIELKEPAAAGAGG